MRPLHRTASSALAGAARRIARRPTGRDWAEALAALAVLAGAGAGLAVLSDALVMDMTGSRARAEPGRILAVALIAVVVPALGEELIFRALAQPARMDGPRATLWSTASLALFIVWHPVQVWCGLPWADPLFLQPAFLVLAGLLGLLCTVLVHRSGSLWTAVFVHWAVVVAWKAGEPFPAPPGAG